MSYNSGSVNIIDLQNQINNLQNSAQYFQTQIANIQSSQSDSETIVGAIKILAND